MSKDREDWKRAADQLKPCCPYCGTALSHMDTKRCPSCGQRLPHDAWNNRAVEGSPE